MLCCPDPHAYNHPDYDATAGASFDAAVQSKFDGTELAEATAATVSSTTSGDK